MTVALKPENAVIKKVIPGGFLRFNHLYFCSLARVARIPFLPAFFFRLCSDFFFGGVEEGGAVTVKNADRSITLEGCAEEDEKTETALGLLVVSGPFAKGRA